MHIREDKINLIYYIILGSTNILTKKTSNYAEILSLASNELPKRN